MFEYNEDNNKIKITRGDSAYYTITLKDLDGNDYELDPESDVIRVQVRTVYNDDDNEGLLFEGTVTDNGDGTATWHILPEDTAQADPKQRHYYDIQLETGGDVFTIVSGKFKILNEVTLQEGE